MFPWQTPSCWLRAGTRSLARRGAPDMDWPLIFTGIATGFLIGQTISICELRREIRALRDQLVRPAASAPREAA